MVKGGMWVCNPVLFPLYTSTWDCESRDSHSPPPRAASPHVLLPWESAHPICFPPAQRLCLTNETLPQQKAEVQGKQQNVIMAQHQSTYEAPNPIVNLSMAPLLYPHEQPVEMEPEICFPFQEAQWSELSGGHWGSITEGESLPFWLQSALLSGSCHARRLSNSGSHSP